MEAVKQDQHVFHLELTDTGIKPVCYYSQWIIDEQAQQRKRRALLTIIFLAYPFFAI